MTQMRVQRKGAIFEDTAKAFGLDDVKELKRDVLTAMAEELVSKSPVDSGTYVKNHEVKLRSGSFQATGIRDSNAPRRTRGDSVSVSGARSEGLSLLMEDIAQVDLEAESFVFRNIMGYSKYIEAGVPNRKTSTVPPYASTVREAPRIIQEVAQKIASRNR